MRSLGTFGTCFIPSTYPRQTTAIHPVGMLCSPPAKAIPKLVGQTPYQEDGTAPLEDWKLSLIYSNLFPKFRLTASDAME